MIKAVVFDFYGVIQTDEVIVWCEKNSEEHPNLRSAVDIASAQIDLDEISLDEYYQELANASNKTVERVKLELKAEIAINQPLLDLAEMLRARGSKTAVLSNDGSSLRSYIEGLNIHKYFDKLFISGELNIMKPDPRIYQRVADDFGVEPQEVLFFDDRQVNIDGALRAGLKAELFTSVVQVRKLLADLL